MYTEFQDIKGKSNLNFVEAGLFDLFVSTKTFCIIRGKSNIRRYIFFFISVTVFRLPAFSKLTINSVQTSIFKHIVEEKLLRLKRRVHIRSFHYHNLYHS